MPNLNEEIDNYAVSYFAGGSTATGYDYRAIIGLARPDASWIGGAYFHRDPSTLPATDTQDPNEYVWLHYHAAEYERVLDLLRSEQPVYLRYLESWSLGWIGTGHEPVGDHDQFGGP